MVARLIIAAPASGHGKTTVATGLLAAFAQRGLRVSPHKVGPDYIDPGYHALAAGRPGRNLDPYLVGEDLIAPLFAHGAAGAELAIVEGVMGLFDGATGQGSFASTFHVASLLGAPVVLVVDAAAQGRSVAALVHGFRSFAPELWLGGVILNRVGSDTHAALLTDALAEVGVPVLGVLRRHSAVSAPSRHLGLVPVAERASEAVRAVQRLGEVCRDGLDLDALLALARSAAPLASQPWSPDAAVLPGPGAGVVPLREVVPGSPVRGVVSGGPVVAVAGGAAFTFGYAETTELLTAAGARVVTFDPLRDEALPAGTQALVVGGGFPEIYADELSANAPLRRSVQALAHAGGVITAECAGLLWLGRDLDAKPMCGVLDVSARMTERLTLGYRSAVALSASVLADEGQRVNGHEFHRTAVEPRAGARPAWAWAGAQPEGFVQGNVHASYLHTHWAGTPSMASRLVAAAAAVPPPAPPPPPLASPLASPPERDFYGSRASNGHASARLPQKSGSAERVPRLVGVGVGPGDPSLVTVKAVQVLQDADRVFVPVLDSAEEPGRAEATVRVHAGHDRVERLVFALNERTDRARRERHWDDAGARVAEFLREHGGTVAFATIGDPNVYSTFSYLAATVRELVPGVEIVTVPGITAMQDLAARSGTPLVEGTELLTLVPFTAGASELKAALANERQTVVAYKGGRTLAEVTAAVRDAGRLDDARYGAHLGLDHERLAQLSEVDADTAPYLSTVLIPAKRSGRGGAL